MAPAANTATNFEVMTPSSILATDAYKFSMGMAGWPLRTERFYFAFRRGGIHYVPFDLKAYVEGLLPPHNPNYEENTYLNQNNYTLSPAMAGAIRSSIRIDAVPKGAWFFEQEPILSVTGPSFLVSWLEAQLTWVNYPIQLATYLLLNPGDEDPIEVVSDGHEEIVQRVFESISVKRETKLVRTSFQERVHHCARDIVHALNGQGDADMRIIEGGMRAAVSMDHHRMVLEACKEVGITRTSNVMLAKELSMVPTGTAGHEHSQRCGNDITAFMNYMDRVPGLASCLLDTWSTLGLGVPAAMLIASNNPSRQFLGRLDSGDREACFHVFANELKKNDINNVMINVAGDVDAEKIRAFEPLREYVGWEPNKLSYMIGGQLTATTLPTFLTRSRVAAVFKLCESAGQPVMKLGDDAGVGKRSLPGRPVTYRRVGGSSDSLPISIIAQEGEFIKDPDHYIRLDRLGISNKFGARAELIRQNYPEAISYKDGTAPATLSPATQQLIRQCTEEAGIHAS